MKNLLALATQAWRRAQPGLAGFAASYALTDTTIPLRKFPENRFNAIIGALAVLIVVVALMARAFNRRFALRRRPAVQPRLEPTLYAREAPAAAAPDTGAWSLALLNALEARRFEAVCAACFESLGYEVHASSRGTERPVDLRLCCRDAERPRILVRCAAAQGAPTDDRAARELLAALEAEGADQGIVVTSSTFTSEARALAGGRKLHLIDGKDLLWKIERLSEARQATLLKHATAGDYAIPTCRICGATAWHCAHYAQDQAPQPAARPDPVEADYWSRIMLP